jgi:hypothetical protein
MPLVTGGDNKITVEIEGKVDDLLKDIKAVDKSLEEFISTSKKADSSVGLTAKAATANWTDFRSAYSTVLDVVRVGQQVWGATVGELVNYGDQVQKLSTITGQSAEEVSRQIQLADDLRVSYDTLAISLRTASKKGFDTSIEGLVKLGEQYKQLPKGIERTQFLMEKFGRSGVEMNKILSQTSDTIRELAANTPDGLIITDKDLEQIKDYNRALDELMDIWSAFKMELGKELVPRISDFLVGLMHQGELWQETIRLMNEGMNLFDAKEQALKNVKEQLYGTADAAGQATDELGGMEDPILATEKAAKDLSKVFDGLLNNMFTINSQREKFADSMASNEEKEKKLAEDRTRKEYDFFIATQEHEKKLKDIQYEIDHASSAEERRKAKEKLLYEQNKYIQEDTIKYYQDLADIDKDLADNQKDKAKLEEDNAKAAKKMIYDLTVERLKASGDVLDSGEFQYAQDLAVQLGLITKADADRAIAASQTADKNVANFERERGGVADINTELETFKSYDGTAITLIVNADTNQLQTTLTQISSLAGMGGTANPAGYHPRGYSPINYSQSFKPGQGSPMHIPAGSRDSGGPGMAGTPYMIGTGAQPEMFVPSQSGQFIPNADKWGSTYNIVINNPKKETAENSIRQTLKKLSFVGVAQ